MAALRLAVGSARFSVDWPVSAGVTLKASSSIGRAAVSKTAGWGFDSLLACHYPCANARGMAAQTDRSGIAAITQALLGNGFEYQRRKQSRTLRLAQVVSRCRPFGRRCFCELVLPRRNVASSSRRTSSNGRGSNIGCTSNRARQSYMGLVEGISN